MRNNSVSRFDSENQGEPPTNFATEPIRYLPISCTYDDGERMEPVRVIFAHRGLFIHRTPGSGDWYTISHIHTGCAVLRPLPSLKCAFDFLRALAYVYDFDALRTKAFVPSKHQKYQLGHIIREARRGHYDGWYIGLEHWLGRDYYRAGGAALAGSNQGGA